MSASKQAVQAAALPEYFYSIANKAIQEDRRCVDMLKADVEEWREALPIHARKTFDRHLERTVDAMCRELYDRRAGQWDAVTTLSAGFELCTMLQDHPAWQATDRFADAIALLSVALDNNWGKAWQDMLHTAPKRAAKLLRVLNERGYYGN